MKSVAHVSPIRRWRFYCITENKSDINTNVYEENLMDGRGMYGNSHGIGRRAKRE